MENDVLTELAFVPWAVRTANGTVARFGELGAALYYLSQVVQKDGAGWIIVYDYDNLTKSYVNTGPTTKVTADA